MFISVVSARLNKPFHILIEELRVGTDCFAFVSEDNEFINVEPTDMFPVNEIENWMKEHGLTPKVIQTTV